MSEKLSVIVGMLECRKGQAAERRFKFSDGVVGVLTECGEAVIIDIGSSGREGIVDMFSNRFGRHKAMMGRWYQKHQGKFRELFWE